MKSYCFVGILREWITQENNENEIKIKGIIESRCLHTNVWERVNQRRAIKMNFGRLVDRLGCVSWFSLDSFLCCILSTRKENYTLAVHSHRISISMFCVRFSYSLSLCWITHICCWILFTFSFNLLDSFGRFLLPFSLCSRRAVRFCFISISLSLTCRRCLCCFLFVALQTNSLHWVSAFVRCAWALFLLFFLNLFFHQLFIFIFFFSFFFSYGLYSVNYFMCMLWPGCTLDERRHNSLLFKHIFKHYICFHYSLLIDRLEKRILHRREWKKTIRKILHAQFYGESKKIWRKYNMSFGKRIHTSTLLIYHKKSVRHVKYFGIANFRLSFQFHFLVLDFWIIWDKILNSTF